MRLCNVGSKVQLPFIPGRTSAVLFRGADHREEAERADLPLRQFFEHASTCALISAGAPAEDQVCLHPVPSIRSAITAAATLLLERDHLVSWQVLLYRHRIFALQAADWRQSAEKAARPALLRAWTDITRVSDRAGVTAIDASRARAISASDAARETHREERLHRLESRNRIRDGV
jgi:hypothetical protein